MVVVGRIIISVLGIILTVAIGKVALVVLGWLVAAGIIALLIKFVFSLILTVGKKNVDASGPTAFVVGLLVVGSWIATIISFSPLWRRFRSRILWSTLPALCSRELETTWP